MSKLPPRSYPKNLLWNMKGRKAKAVEIDGRWKVRIRWSQKLGLEHHMIFEKEPRKLVANINDPKSRGILVNGDNTPWHKITGRALDETFLQHHLSW